MSVAPLQDNAPQTTPSTVDDNTIQPNQDANQPTPTTPQVQPGAAPTAPTSGAPAPSQPQASQPPVVQPAQRKSLFDRVLQGMVGGPSRVTDPHTGETSEVPMTRSSITKHILAGAITGIISHAQGEDQVGPAGTRTPGNMAALSGGFNATQAKMDQMRNAPQARMDADTLNKQRAMQNNLFEMQNQVAIGKLHEDQWDQAEGYYNKSKDIYEPVIQNIETADKSLGKGEPSLFVPGARGISYQDAMKQMEGHHGEYQAVQDGFTTQDIGGRTAHVPTYSLVRNKGTVNVDRATLGALAKYNGDISNLLDKSGTDNVPMSITQLLGLEKDAHQGQAAESWINSIRASIDKAHAGEKDYKPLGEVKDFNTAYKNDSTVHSQVDQLMTTLGSYGTHSNVSALDELMQGQKGGALMSFFGVDKDALASFVNKSREDIKSASIEQEGLAKAKGALMAKGITSIKTANAILSNVGSSDEMKQWAQTFIDMEEKSEVGIAGQKATASKMAQTAALSNNPQTIQEASNIVTGDFGKITDIAGRGGPERQAILNALHNEAQWRGLNPNEFSAAALTSKGELISEYSGKGKTRANLTAFDTFLGHSLDARAAADMMQRKGTMLGGVPIMRVARKELANKLSGDPDWTAMSAALLPVKKEYMTFLNAGFAEQEEDRKSMDAVLDDTKTPEQTITALTSLAQSADVRVAALGRTFLGTVGTTYPNLISSKGKAALKSFGAKGDAELMSTPLPRGNDQVIDPKKHAKEIQTFLKVAGGDKDTARELAKKNGWFLTAPGPRPGVLPQPETTANPNSPAKKAGPEIETPKGTGATDVGPSNVGGIPVVRHGITQEELDARVGRQGQ